MKMTGTKTTTDWTRTPVERTRKCVTDSSSSGQLEDSGGRVNILSTIPKGGHCIKMASTLQALEYSLSATDNLDR